MDLTAILIFCGLYILGVATPGPGVVAVVSRSLSHGTLSTLPFILGMALGDVTWFCLSAFGYSLLAGQAAPYLGLLHYLGAAYLLYLSWDLWRSRPDDATEDAESSSIAYGFGLPLSGYIFTLGNPKTMSFFLAVLPQTALLNRLETGSILILAIMVFVLLSGIMGGYALLAGSARNLLLSPRALQLVNRTSSALLAGVALLIVLI